VHRGKAAALNAAVAEARGEIVVFADARQRLDRSAVRELVANFSDPSVGAATGELILCDETGKEASDGVGLYWKYEKKIRSMESRIHSLCGATGAIHAIRREMFEPLPEDTILDDMLIPMRILVSGKRVVLDPAARAYDRVAAVQQVEYSRKVRTLTGNYQLMALMPELLLPWRNPVFFQFISHKVGRLLMPYCLVALLLSNFFLLHGVYRISLLLQTAWYLSALVGFAIAHKPTSPRAPDPLAPAGNKEAA
jgi:cellulose synthase/poly-beta-1,6-N-acetylglucosamine synthase-like glycosyltransferase